MFGRSPTEDKEYLRHGHRVPCRVHTSEDWDLWVSET